MRFNHPSSAQSLQKLIVKMNCEFAHVNDPQIFFMTLHTEIRDVESIVDCQEQCQEPNLLLVLFFKANYTSTENGLILHSDAI